MWGTQFEVLGRKLLIGVGSSMTVRLGWGSAMATVRYGVGAADSGFGEHQGDGVVLKEVAPEPDGGWRRLAPAMRP
jgi:hypothetical protein